MLGIRHKGEPLPRREDSLLLLLLRLLLSSTSINERARRHS
jgi:hypothetical protein